MLIDKIPPNWAQNLVRRITGDYEVVYPYIQWTKRKSKISTGWCALEGNAIGIRTGSDKADARYTILHELAHYILLHLHKTYTGQHDKIYYEFLWPFLRRYRSPMKAAVRFEEGHHRKTVTRTYLLGGGRLDVLLGKD